MRTILRPARTAWLRFNIGNRMSKYIANYDGLAHPFAHRAAAHGRYGADMSANQQRAILDCVVHAFLDLDSQISEAVAQRRPTWTRFADRVANRASRRVDGRLALSERSVAIPRHGRR